MTTTTSVLKKAMSSVPCMNLDTLGVPYLKKPPSKPYAWKGKKWRECTRQAGQVADALRSIKELRKSLEQTESQLKKVLLQYHQATGTPVFTGDRAQASISQGSREYMPKEQVVTKLGMDWWNKNVKITTYTQINITPLNPEE